MEKESRLVFRQRKGADIAIFPEMWSCGYVFPHEEASSLNVPFLGMAFVKKRFAELAAELDMAIAITFLSNMSRNREIQFAFFDRHGKIQYCYSKKSIFVILGRR